MAAKLGQDVAFIAGATRGAELEAAINALEDGQVLLVENTRFEDVDGKKESKTTKNLVNTGLHLVTVSSLTTHLVLHTAHTHQTLVSQQT